jgi:hypothetical protein
MIPPTDKLESKISNQVYLNGLHFYECPLPPELTRAEELAELVEEEEVVGAAVDPVLPQWVVDEEGRRCGCTGYHCNYCRVQVKGLPANCWWTLLLKCFHFYLGMMCL